MGPGHLPGWSRAPEQSHWAQIPALPLVVALAGRCGFGQVTSSLCLLFFICKIERLTLISTSWSCGTVSQHLGVLRAVSGMQPELCKGFCYYQHWPSGWAVEWAPALCSKSLLALLGNHLKAGRVWPCPYCFPGAEILGHW